MTRRGPREEHTTKTRSQRDMSEGEWKHRLGDWPDSGVVSARTGAASFDVEKARGLAKDLLEEIGEGRVRERTLAVMLASALDDAVAILSSVHAQVGRCPADKVVLRGLIEEGGEP